MKLNIMQKARLFAILLCGVAALFWVMTYRTDLGSRDYLNRLAWGNPATSHKCQQFKCLAGVSTPHQRPGQSRPGA